MLANFKKYKLTQTKAALTIVALEVVFMFLVETLITDGLFLNVYHTLVTSIALASFGGVVLSFYAEAPSLISARTAKSIRYILDTAASLWIACHISNLEVTNLFNAVFSWMVGTALIFWMMCELSITVELISYCFTNDV